MAALQPDAVADLVRENTRLQIALRAAQDRQDASAEILRTIANVSGDAEQSLQRIAEITARLFDAPSVTIQIAEGDGWSHTIRFGDNAKRVGATVPVNQLRIGGRNMPGRIVAENRQIHVPDLDNVDPAIADWPGLPPSRAAGTRTMAGTPLRREGNAIGVMIVYLNRLAPFTDEELALQQRFADQAAIAIENSRLFNETKEALERQTASANILKAIAASPTDITPVLKAIVESACELCQAVDAVVFLKDGDRLSHEAHHGPITVVFDENRPISRDYLAGRSVIDKVPIHVRDIFSEEGAEFPVSRELSRSGGIRSILAVPLLRENECIGTILLRRTEVHPFSDKHIAFLQTYADQAVIAIENVRLFDEVQAKTRDLTESLQQQTATADVLKVISRSAFDLQTVLDTLVESAARLCDADRACVFKKTDELFHWVSNYGFSDQLIAYANTHPFAAGLGSTTSRVALEGKAIHNPDVLSDPNYKASEYQRLGNYRTMLGIPLLREGAPIGVFILAREQVRPFTDRQIELVTSFADQAVIAIENVRLFDEVQAKTRDLSESLQQQTATADVLKVISRSAYDLQAVLDTLVESAARLCEADKGVIFKRDGDLYRWSANFGNPPELETFAKANPFKPGHYAVTSRVALEGKTFHVSDVLTDPEYGASAYQKLGGYRTILGVPLLREGTPIGVFALTRSEVRPFTSKQIELVESFADQAVIAIENVRLFDEVQARTKELAASLDDLRTAQDRLVQTEKLASLGQLTAGIAHEIKNPLNFVNNFSSLSAELTDELNDVLKSAELGDKIREEVDELTGLLKDNLQKVVQHGKRADSIVKNMLLHSREGSGDHRPADINALLDESLNLAYHGARAEKPGFNVTLQRDFDERAGMIEVFPQEITRVFLNLISNGFYAVSKRKSEAVDSGFDPVLRASTKSLGDTVEIRIRDNGTGIPAEVKDKIFNPFFTTKPAGEGTGLGLSMSHDIIVKQHGGSINVETEPGQFTEFTIVLPRRGNSSSRVRGQT